MASSGLFSPCGAWCVLTNAFDYTLGPGISTRIWLNTVMPLERGVCLTNAFDYTLGPGALGPGISTFNARIAIKQNWHIGTIRDTSLTNQLRRLMQLLSIPPIHFSSLLTLFHILLLYILCWSIRNRVCVPSMHVLFNWSEQNKTHFKRPQKYMEYLGWNSFCDISWFITYITNDETICKNTHEHRITIIIIPIIFVRY